MTDSLPAGPEPAAKRVRLYDEEAARNNIEVPMEDHTDKLNLLEWLNKDCLHAVFNFLSTGDILRSVKVSRQWREEVLEYLRAYRFCFEFYHDDRVYTIPRLVRMLISRDEHRRTMPPDMCHGDPTQLGDNIQELGPAIVSIILDRLDGTILKIIAQNCPNLKEFVAQGEPITFTEDVLHSIHNMKLRRVSFRHYPIVPELPENIIAEFLKSDSLEEIIIFRKRLVNGSCLSGLRAINLKTLRLNGCNLNSTHLMSVADRLSTLTTLDLSNNPPEFLPSVHLLLQRTPNLEDLTLDTYMHVEMGTELVEALCSLDFFKYLSMRYNQNVSDEWLEILAAGCKTLQALDIQIEKNKNLITARGVRALGRARSLVLLGLNGRAGAALELLACVTGCPNLEWVDVRGCTLTPELHTAIANEARARSKPLTLQLEEFDIIV